MPDSFLLSVLADPLLAGRPDIELLLDRCTRTFGKRWRWLRPFITRYLQEFGSGARPRRRDVIAFLRNDKALQRALTKYSDVISNVEWLTVPQRMLPSAGTENWGLPVIESPGDLAKWLGLAPAELRWFADLKALGYKSDEPRLRHYHYRVMSKRFGAVRLIEAPKARLKDRQRQILLWMLGKIPSHPAVHGLVKGRSIRTFVAPHVGQRIVLRVDLQDFFPTFGGLRIQNLFRTFGYPEEVADLLGGLCTNATPRDVWNEFESEFGTVQTNEIHRMYVRPHLPQGAPTTPLTQKVISSLNG